MKSEIKKLPKSSVEIKVEITADALKPFLAEAAKKLGRELKMDGFRPGKIPADVIRRKVGDDGLLHEAIDEIVGRTYYEAVLEHNLVTVGEPKIEIKEAAAGKNLIYQATVAILPSVKIGDYAKIKIERQKPAVQDNKVESVIGDIRKMRAREALVDRAARMSDRLEIDFEVFLDKVAIEGGTQKKYPITLGEGRFIPGFEEKLICIQAGETREFDLKFPEKYYQKNIAGKNCRFKVKCLAVYEVTLPAVNDAFAQDLSRGQFKTAAELKQNIKVNLEQEEKNKAEQRLEIEMMGKLIDICEFTDEIPEVMMESEIHRMIHEFEDSLSDQGAAFEDYLKSINKTREDLEKDFRPQAEKRAKTAIVSREIYQAQKMSVDDGEVAQETAELLKHYPADNEAAKKQISSAAYQEYLKNRLGNRKVLAHLKSVMVK